MTHGTHNAVHDKRNENVFIYINGEMFSRQEAKISVFDSGVLSQLCQQIGIPFEETMLAWPAGSLCPLR